MGIVTEAFGDRIEMIGTIVKSGDDREADDDRGACGIKAVEVVEDGLKRDARPLAMASVVHVFEVEEKESGPGDQCGQVFPGAEPASFKAGIQTGLGGGTEQFQSEDWLGEGFAAAQGDAAARVFIKAAVAKRNLEDFRNGGGAPRQSQGLRRASLDAGAADDASLAEKRVPAQVNLMDRFRTGFDAVATSDTASSEVGQEGLGSLGFGIMTPAAV